MLQVISGMPHMCHLLALLAKLGCNNTFYLSGFCRRKRCPLLREIPRRYSYHEAARCQGALSFPLSEVLQQLVPISRHRLCFPCSLLSNGVFHVAFCPMPAASANASASAIGCQCQLQCHAFLRDSIGLRYVCIPLSL
jgi:hypothetical protein